MGVAILLVRAALPHFDEAEAPRIRETSRGFSTETEPINLRDCDRLGADEFRLQFRLAILQQHGHDLLQIPVQLLQRLALRMRAGKARNVAHEKLGLGTPFHYGCVSFHRFRKLLEPTLRGLPPSE